MTYCPWQLMVSLAKVINVTCFLETHWTWQWCWRELPLFCPAMTRWTGSPGGIFADGTAWTLSASRQGRQSSSHKIIIPLLSHFCRIHISTIYNRKIKDMIISPPREENEFLKQRMINGLIRFFWTSGRSKLSTLSKLSKSASEASILSETQYPILIWLFKDV